MKPAHDVQIVNHGTLYAFTLETKAGQEWVADNVDIPGWAWLGAFTFAVEHRYALALADAMADAGLRIH